MEEAKNQPTTIDIDNILVKFALQAIGYRADRAGILEEAKQAILADLLAMPELQEPPKHWSTDKDTKELMDAAVADYHEDIRQALTAYFEGVEKKEGK